MSRSPGIPAELTERPFSLDEARKAGLTLSALKGRAWRRLGYELYCWSELEVDAWSLLSAWRKVLPSGAVFAGATAAWLLGLDIEPTRPVEIRVPPWSGVRSRAGLDVRRSEVQPGEIVTVRGLRSTALHRTLMGTGNDEAKTWETPASSCGSTHHVLGPTNHEPSYALGEP